MEKKFNIFMAYTDKPDGSNEYNILAKALNESVVKNFPSANLIIDKNYPLDNPRYGAVPHNAICTKI